MPMMMRSVIRCLCLVGWVGLFLGGLGLLSGCASGGDDPPSASVEEVRSRGLNYLESVSTNLRMDTTDARKLLSKALVDFRYVRQQSPDDTEAIMGSAFSYTLFGYFELLGVLPADLRQALESFTTQSGSRMRAIEPADLLARTRAAFPDVRSSNIQTVQLRIASQTLPAVKSGLPLYEQLEEAARNGVTLQLRLYQHGQIRTILFDVADIQLLSAYAQAITGLLNVAIVYNLDIPNGVTVRPLPVDANGNGMFDPEEYLISAPFLDRFSAQAMSSALQNLRFAAGKAKLGASLSGHTLGPNALLDVQNTDVQAQLARTREVAELLEVAATSEISTDRFFPDGIVRTINLPKLTSLSTLRPFLPSFQKDDLTTPGVWPDPTFMGVVVPGMPQDAVQILYGQIDTAY
jgi:hypothetical protein